MGDTTLFNKEGEKKEPTYVKKLVHKIRYWSGMRKY